MQHVVHDCNRAVSSSSVAPRCSAGVRSISKPSMKPEWLPTGWPPSQTSIVSLTPPKRRETVAAVPVPSPPLHTQVVGGREGGIISYTHATGTGYEFHFRDDDGDEWIVNLPLHELPYDPYFDPMSEPAVHSWYLLVRKVLYVRMYT